MTDRTEPTPGADGDEPAADARLEAAMERAAAAARDAGADAEPVRQADPLPADGSSAHDVADADAAASAARTAPALAPPAVDVGTASVAASEPKKKGWPLSSVLLLGLAAALAVLSVLLYTGTVRLGPQTPPPPDATPGAIRTVDVIGALRAQGLSAEPDQKLFVPMREFKVPGQGIRVGDAPLLVFIFDDPATAEAAFAAADPANVLPPTLPGGGGPVQPDQVTLARGSNVAVALVGGDEDTRARVTTAIEGLP